VRFFFSDFAISHDSLQRAGVMLPLIARGGAPEMALKVAVCKQVRIRNDRESSISPDRNAKPKPDWNWISAQIKALGQLQLLSAALRATSLRRSGT
jgi:hypothetical protein